MMFLSPLFCDGAKGMAPLRHAEQNQAGKADGQQSAPFHFECPLTVFKAESAPEGKKRRIAGIISTDSADRQNERILQDGLSFQDFIQHGWFNDNHSAATTDILGYPESVSQFDVGDTLPDGTTASARGTWVEGYLLDTKKANDVWELAQSLAKTHRRLGYSVEGSIESRTGADESTIAKAKVRNVAITNCFPGDVRVSAVATGISRRVYDGPIVDLKLASGHQISGTPNHPILTQRGWVALGELDKSKDRIGRSLAYPGNLSGMDHDVKDMPPRLDEVYNSAHCQDGVHHVRPGCPGDFHGDGSSGNVDIVAARGFLRNTAQAAFLQHFEQLLLTCPDATQLGLMAEGSFDEVGGAGNGAKLRSLSRQDAVPTLLSRAFALFSSIFSRDVPVDSSVLGQFVNPASFDIKNFGKSAAPFALPVPDKDLGFSRICQRVLDRAVEYFVFAQEFAHSHMTDAHLCSDGGSAAALLVQGNPFSDVPRTLDCRLPSNSSLSDKLIDAADAYPKGGSNVGDTLSRCIAFERISDCTFRQFSGHVYNLESVSGWYIANGISGRNCPVNTDSRLEILARSLGAQNAILARAMTLADSSGSAGPAKPNRAYTGQGAGQVLSRESFGNKPKKKRKSNTLTRSEAVAYVQAQVPGCSEALARAIVLRTIQSNHP